jgi:DNA-binding phage protein
LNSLRRIARNAAGGPLAKRKNSQRSADAKSADLLASNLGGRALVFDQNDVIRLLQAAVEREGSQSAFAKRCGVERSRLNRTLSGKLPVGDSVAKALGLRKVYVAE